MGSPDIVEYAAKNGWYDEAKDGPFDFKKAFDRPCGRRSHAGTATPCATGGA